MKQQKVRRSRRVLIKAVFLADYEAVNNLLEKGANINEVDYKGNSPLHYATSAKNLKMIELLLQRNARVDIENNDGEIACEHAILFDFDFINIFVQYKSEVRIHAIIIDKIRKYPDNFRKLLYENVNVEYVDFLGYTALHYAVKSNDLIAIRTLISRGAEVNKFFEPLRDTPLHFAKSTESIKILLRKGAEPNVHDKFLESPLLIIVTNSNINYGPSIERKEQWRMIEELIRNNANCIEVIYKAQRMNHNELSKSRYGVEDVLKFMALKEHKHHYMNIDNLMLNQDNVLSSFYRHCLNEVVLLKEEKLSDYLTYYDFVANNIHKLSKYVDNKSVKKAFKNESKLTYMFPIYSEILWGHFKEATEERKLREAACSSLSYAIPCINADHIVTYEILNFIEIEDMKNIVQAFPLVKL